MTHYEIYFFKGQYEIWKCHNDGIHYDMTRFKVFKTKKGAENWAKKTVEPGYLAVIPPLAYT